LRTAEFFTGADCPERGERIGGGVVAAADDSVFVGKTQARNEIDRDGSGTGRTRASVVGVARRAGTALDVAGKSVVRTAAGNNAGISCANKSGAQIFVRQAADYTPGIDRAGGGRSDDGRKRAGRSKGKIKFAADSGGRGGDVGKTKVFDDGGRFAAVHCIKLKADAGEGLVDIAALQGKIGSVEDGTGEGVADGRVGGETAGDVGGAGAAGEVARGESYTAGRKVGESDGTSGGLGKGKKEERR
jgi:hypothetical protein